MAAPQDNVMQQVMHQFTAFLWQQQNLQQETGKQDRIWKMQQSVTDKLGRFEGRDITKYSRAYEQAMEDNGATNDDAIEQFHLIVLPELWGRIDEI